TPIWVGLPGILVSPTHGILAYSPVFLFAILGSSAVWLRCKSITIQNLQIDPLLGRYLSICALIQLILMSHWWSWYGGVAYNQRMLQEIHPILIVLSALGLQAYSKRLWIRRLLIMAVVWGVFMNLARIGFYAQHLDWVEKYHPDLVWSFRYSEIPMYIQWHSLLGFIGGVGQVLLKVGSIFILLSLIFFRLLTARQVMVTTDKQS
ncbi:MAG: hypothetical protein P1S60_18895, partial [Anaerolineae bacterium]|nr:hypothetical protein [Anaerolineae bacterium]